jgi:hypothetical protein
MDEQKPFKDRLKNLLNNVHSVRIQTSQDNSCIFIERIYNNSPGTNARDSNEESTEERGNSSVDAPPRSHASINEQSEDQNENHSLMVPKYQKKIIQRLEKIIEERKQSGDSNDHSPYRVKLTAHDNS